MSCDEIRYWIRELVENEALGWKGRKTAIATALGIHTDRACAHLSRKLDPDCWIYPGEQIRFSKGIGRILAGELVCRLRTGVHRGVPSYRPVLADDPKPLALPKRLRYNLGTGRLEHVSSPLVSRPTMPSFKDVLRNAPVGELWRE